MVERARDKIYELAYYIIEIAEGKTDLSTEDNGVYRAIASLAKAISNLCEDYLGGAERHIDSASVRIAQMKRK